MPLFVSSPMGGRSAPPFKQAEFDVLYGQGISREGLLIDLGVEARVVDKSGAWFSYGDTRLGQGRENARQFLRDNPDIADAVEVELKSKLGYVKSAATNEQADEPVPAEVE